MNVEGVEKGPDVSTTVEEVPITASDCEDGAVLEVTSENDNEKDGNSEFLTYWKRGGKLHHNITRQSKFRLGSYPIGVPDPMQDSAVCLSPNTYGLQPFLA
ncbi:hypothetical protein NQZ68_038425 [Dissostichus eleginoides]|nr:hypothetical protein NQZ68_038425 [Dissostichus eleginoides]